MYQTSLNLTMTLSYVYTWHDKNCDARIRGHANSYKILSMASSMTITLGSAESDLTFLPISGPIWWMKSSPRSHFCSIQCINAEHHSLSKFLA